MPQRVPTTLVTGFLGSGKTTIISHLIEELQTDGTQVAYIKNEIGENDIDTQLMRGKHIVSKELLNGCICCTLVGPFISAVTELINTYHPDRIIIEASGTADPAALALMVSSHPLLFRDGVISIIDVVNFEGYEDLTTTAQQQTQFTDLIIFNKIELVDDARKETVVGYVRELNSHSPILEAPHGQINPEVVFGSSSNELATLLAEEKNTHHDHKHHLDDDYLEAFSVTPGKLSLPDLQSFIEQLPKQVFRVKGFVQDSQNTWWLVNSVACRVDFQPQTSHQNLRPTLIFIGYKARELQDRISQQLSELVLPPIPRQNDGSVRPG